MNWKTIRIRSLQLVTGLGTVAAGLGTLPVESAALPMPAEWRPYIISVGFFAMTIKTWLPMIGDFIDDGERNNSYKP